MKLRFAYYLCRKLNSVYGFYFSNLGVVRFWFYHRNGYASFGVFWKNIRDVF